jgi:hypothetical protein
MNFPTITCILIGWFITAIHLALVVSIGAKADRAMLNLIGKKPVSTLGLNGGTANGLSDLNVKSECNHSKQSVGVKAQNTLQGK